MFSGVIKVVSQNLYYSKFNTTDTSSFCAALLFCTPKTFYDYNDFYRCTENSYPLCYFLHKVLNLCDHRLVSTEVFLNLTPARKS